MLATKIQTIFRHLSLALVGSLLLASMAVASASASTPAAGNGGSSKPAVPAFCKSVYNGTLSKSDKKLCANIPAGCPGSSQTLPKTAPKASSCPYAGTPQAAKSTSSSSQTSAQSSSNTTGIKCNVGGKEVDCSQVQDQAATSGSCQTANKCDLISKYINPLIDFLSAAIGIIVVASIIIGGIQYSSAGGDPQKVSAAKSRIRNAIVALVTYIFLLALLNFLVPGGL